MNVRIEFIDLYFMGFLSLFIFCLRLATVVDAAILFFLKVLKTEISLHDR